MANQIDTDAKVIVGDSKGFGHPAICRLSNTVMLAAHINQSDELEIHKSIDNGLNWTLKKTLPNASGCFNFVNISSTKAGIVYQKNNDEFEVWISIDSGDNWTNKLDITGQTATDKAILLYDSNINRMHVVYRSSAFLTGKYSDNDGGNWTDWVGLSLETTIRVYDADVRLSDGYIFVAYYHDGTYSLDTRWFSSTGNYISWNRVGDAAYSHFEVNYVIDSTGNRWISYIRRFAGSDYLKIEKNEGSTTTLFTGAYSSIIRASSSIAVDEDNNIYVFYTKTSDEKTYYRKYDAGTTTWESEVELIGLANNRINTEKHVLAGSNKLHYVYYKQP